MKISYNTVKDFKGNTYKKLQTQLTLNRIEYKPSFHSEYDMAKKAIEKYLRTRINKVSKAIIKKEELTTPQSTSIVDLHHPTEKEENTL